MGHELFVATDAKSITAALDVSVTRPNVPGSPPPLVAGNKPVIDLYFTNRATSDYASWSGTTSGYTVELALVHSGGENSRPAIGTLVMALTGTEMTSGTLTVGKRYRINDLQAGDDFSNVHAGTETGSDGFYFVATGTTPTTWSNSSELIEVTENLNYNATASDVEDALNAMQEVIDAGLLDVIGTTAGGPYTLTWRDQGNQPAVTGYVENLSPKTTLYTSTVTAGDASTREVQLLELRRNVYAYNATWTQILDGGSSPIGYRGTLDLNVDGVKQLLSGRETVSCKLEIRVNDGTNTTTYALIDVIVRNNGIGENTTTPTPLPTYPTLTEADARYLQQSNDLSDLGSASTARTNLGLGSAAVADFLDEDNMASDDPNAAPSQQSVKAYVDAGLSGKANASHTHTEGDITDLDKYTQAEVNARLLGKADTQHLIFDGVSGYGGLPASLSGVFTGNATISLLVKLDDGQPSGSQTIIGATDASDDTFTLSVNSSGQIVIAIGDGTSTVTHTSVAYFSDGASDWTWLLVAIDTAAHEMQLYVNGTAYGSAEDISSLDMSAASVPALYLAARNNNGTADQFLKGAVAALDVYNLALTPDAIGNGAVKPFLRWATPSDSTVYAASDAGGTSNCTVDEVNGISDGVTSFDGVLRCYPDAGTLGNRYFYFLDAFEVGQTYKVSMWYYIPSDNTAVDGFDFQSSLDSASQFTDPFTGLLVGNVRSTGATGDGAFTSVVGTWTYIEFFIQPNYAIPQIELYDGNNQALTATGAVDDNEIYFKDITITNVGAVGSYRFGEGVGYQPKDQSSNHYDGLLSVTGATWSHPKKHGTLRDFGLDANGQADYVVSSSRDTLPANAIITSFILINNDGDAIGAGKIKINRYDGTNRATVQIVSSGVTAGQGVFFMVTGSQDLADRRVEIPDESSAGMDDFDIQINYEVLA